MKSGCSEDTQHISGPLQIRAPQAGGWGGGAFVCLSVGLRVREEAARLEMCEL